MFFFLNGAEPYFRKTDRIPGFHTNQIHSAPSWNEQPVGNRHQECQTLVTLAWTPGSYVENIIEVPFRENTFRHLFAIVLSISGYHLSTSTVAFTQIQKTPPESRHVVYIFFFALAMWLVASRLENLVTLIRHRRTSSNFGVSLVNRDNMFDLITLNQEILIFRPWKPLSMTYGHSLHQLIN